MIGNKVSRMSIFTTLIQHSVGSPSQHKRGKKGIRTDWKRRNETVPVFLRYDHMCRKFQIIYKKSVALTSEFIKITRYKTNIQKAVSYTLAMNM